ncbi:MAG: class I SAM-dependent methyltransferase [Candidatus Neomarinimicrobiota bacterium]
MKKKKSPRMRIQMIGKEIICRICSVGYQISRFVTRSRLLYEQEEVGRKTNGTLKPTESSLNAVIRRQLTESEKILLHKISDVRSELSASTTQITMQDFGAQRNLLRKDKSDEKSGRIVTKIVGKMYADSTICEAQGRFIFNLVREFRPAVCLELGTCLGISAAYIGAALELNQTGRLISIEGSDSLVKIATANLAKIGLTQTTVISGRFQDKLPQVLKEWSPLGFVFIDGHHEEWATLNYFEEILPFAGQNALFLFDDIYWSFGMNRAWRKIRADRRISFSWNRFMMGVAFKA